MSYHKEYWGRPENKARKRYNNWVRQLRVRYGITPEDYDEMLRDQEGQCLICETAQIGERKLCVDHCHITGVVRGLLCDRCNTAIGLFEDSVALLGAAARYLKEK